MAGYDYWNLNSRSRPGLVTCGDYVVTIGPVRGDPWYDSRSDTATIMPDRR
jgi:hypothetical protein